LVYFATQSASGNQISQTVLEKWPSFQSVGQGEMSEEATPTPSSGSEEKEFVLNADGSILIDHNGKPVTVERFLCTKPLRAEVSTRKGPGGMKLTYMGGDMVTKTLNEAFGYNGWCLEVKNTSREEPIKDEKGRYHVAYIATVRVTHQRSGVFRGKTRKFLLGPQRQ